MTWLSVAMLRERVDADDVRAAALPGAASEGDVQQDSPFSVVDESFKTQAVSEKPSLQEEKAQEGSEAVMLINAKVTRVIQTSPHCAALKYAGAYFVHLPPSFPFVLEVKDSATYKLLLSAQSACTGA